MLTLKKQKNVNLLKYIGIDEDEVFIEIVEKRDIENAEFISHKNVWKRFF